MYQPANTPPSCVALCYDLVTAGVFSHSKSRPGCMSQVLRVDSLCCNNAGQCLLVLLVEMFSLFTVFWETQPGLAAEDS